MLQYLVTISLNSECYTRQFPRNLYVNDSALTMVVTESGFNHFISKFKQDTHRIIGTRFPDQNFHLNLGIIAVDFKLSDIIITDFIVHEAFVILDENQQLQMNIVNASAVFNFQWEFKQTSYPYTSDQGSGKIIIKDVSAHLTMQTDCSYDECPNKMISNVLNVQIQIGVLHLQLSGGQSWIYQSMIELVINAVKNILVGKVEIIAKEALIYGLNSLFIFYRPTKQYQNFQDIIKDERYTNGWTVGKGYGAIMYSGYVYNQNNFTDEYMQTSMLQPIILNRFNSHVQVIIQAAAFNNVYYIFHKYYNSYSTTDYTIPFAPYIEFYDQKALLTMQIIYQGVQYTIKLAGNPLLQKIGDQSCAYFELQKYEMKPYNEILEDLVLQNMNSVIKNTCYMIMNNPFMDPYLSISRVKAILTQDDNSIRFLTNFE
ncbi:Conserved_hypothetical protein [Hexamita inflata]|uniref:BPI-like protein n=1 Tax=Hexamita inflata TaxID=28002 RepID=A0AA86Q7E9_9EUKA|nr:Conserved hypothetical protein [Hexamita inflata]